MPPADGDEHRGDGPDQPDGAPGRGRPAWLTPNLVVLCGGSFLQDAASELLYPIIPIFLTSVLGAPVSVVGAVEGLAKAVASGAKVITGRLADRLRRRPLIAAGYGLAAVGKVVISVAFAWPVVLCGRAIDRLGKGIRTAPRDALLVEDVQGPARGRAFGLHRAADTMGAVVGPLIGLAGSGSRSTGGSGVGLSAAATSAGGFGPGLGSGWGESPGPGGAAAE